MIAARMIISSDTDDNGDEDCDSVNGRDVDIDNVDDNENGLKSN